VHPRLLQRHMLLRVQRQDVLLHVRSQVLCQELLQEIAVLQELLVPPEMPLQLCGQLLQLRPVRRLRIHVQWRHFTLG